MKKCSRCQNWKMCQEFYSCKNRIRNWCKKCDLTAASVRKTLLKQSFVDYKGGKCSICGYNKYIGALEFHHLDPSKKDFNLSQAKIFNDKVKQELDKCILVCSNCHREEHYKIKAEESIENNNFYISERNNRLTKKPKNKKLCCDCGNNKDVNAKQCKKCFILNRKKFNIDIHLVIQKIKENGFVSAGKHFGISDNGLRKFLKRNGVNPKTIKREHS